jgi:drug/metabolite transporter (DMT)-like permease
LWGLVFLAPELARSFSPLHLTVGRYLAYGLIAGLLLAPRWRALAPVIGRREWLALGWLSLAGNTVYYLLLASAVQLGGVAMTSLVIGFLPVTVTIIGSRDDGAVPLARLAPSLALSLAGAACIGWQAVAAPLSGAVAGNVTGLACAVGALVCWTAYAVGNSRALSRLGAVSAHDWNLLTGIVTGAQSLVLLPFALVVGTGRQTPGQWAMFAGVSIGAAVLASIGGNALWHRMTRLLPLTLVGQMILFETLFALAYGFAWERRLPSALEVGAFGLLMLSVLSCLSAHRRQDGAVL